MKQMNGWESQTRFDTDQRSVYTMESACFDGIKISFCCCRSVFNGLGMKFFKFIFILIVLFFNETELNSFVLGESKAPVNVAFKKFSI